MYIYKVTFGDGSQMNFRANSPRQANELASKIAVVSHIKWLR